VRIEILPEARDDLIAGFRFYERQAPGLGSYFRESILTDVDTLATHGGVPALPSVHLARCAIHNNAVGTTRMERLGRATWPVKP
jgi:hypothetical protein